MWLANHWPALTTLWTTIDWPKNYCNILISLHQHGYFPLLHKQNKHLHFWMTDTLMVQLTVTSFPRLISAKIFFMPSPLPTCQMVASTGWLVIGQSLAWSSYQIVLEVGKRKSILFEIQMVDFLFSQWKLWQNSTRCAWRTYPKAYTSAAVEKGRRSSLLPGLILHTISGAR